MTEIRSQICKLLCQGLCNKEIAKKMGRAEITIKSHLTEIFRELGVNSRVKAVIKLLTVAKI